MAKFKIMTFVHTTGYTHGSLLVIGGSINLQQSIGTLCYSSKQKGYPANSVLRFHSFTSCGAGNMT